MNVYDQIEKLLNQNEDRPLWVDEILHELREIKRLIADAKSNHPISKGMDKNSYFAFVKRLRKELRADIQNGIYPQINYLGRELGINFKGYIYDKATSKELPAHEAFEVYRFLYDNREKLENYVIK